MPPFQRGPGGAPLSQGEWVIRLAERDRLLVFPESTRLDPLLFALSTSDRQSRPPHLSVWAGSLTTPAQAWELMGARLKHCIAVWLNVDAVRKLLPEHRLQQFSLDFDGDGEAPTDSRALAPRMRS